MSTALSARVVSHRCHGFLTRNIEALCGVLVPYVAVSRTAYPLLLSSSSRDTLITRVRRAGLEMRPPDVLESLNFHFSRCSPVASRASTEHELGALQWERGRQRAARVFWCQLAHSLGLLRNQSGSDEWIRSITLVRVDPSCSDGFQHGLVQVTHRNFTINLAFTHEHQLFIDNISHHLGVQWQSSGFVV